MMWMQLRVIYLLLYLIVGHMAVARMVANPLPQDFTPRLIIVDSNALLSEVQKFEQEPNSEHYLKDSKIKSLIFDDYNSYNSDNKEMQPWHIIGSAAELAQIMGKNNLKTSDTYDFLYSGNIEDIQQGIFPGAKAKPYVHLASMKILVESCLSGAILSMAPWAIFGKEQMESATITGFIVFVLTAGGLLIGPRLKIIKQLKSGKMSVAELYEPIMNNKNSLKHVSVILAGTCYIVMEGIILKFFTDSDQI